MAQNKKLAIVVPCYNEISTIVETYRKVKQFGIPIIVDDCSNDGTKEKLKSEKIDFISNELKSGYEITIKNGFNYIFKNFNEIEYVATIDADLELPAEYLSKLYDKAVKEDLDIVIGSRNKLNRFTELILKILFNLKFNIKDPISGLKIYKIKKLKDIFDKASNELFLVDILIYSFYKKLKIGSENITTKKRAGKPRVGTSLLVNFKIINIILNSLSTKKFKQ